MKIAVYTIAKDEANFASRWAESCQEADQRLVLDTGSTDNTVKILKAWNVTVVTEEIKPWRFDVARNRSLDLLDDDIDVCVCLDMDEVLLPGWREVIEKAFTDDPNLTRLRYNYVWSWAPDGTPGLTYFADKIHKRNVFRWHHPVHEVMKPKRDLLDRQVHVTDTLIHHYPDVYKPRNAYLDLLHLATQEEPEDDRMSHYYARELYFKGFYHGALEEFKRHLELPNAKWGAERAASMKYISDCYFKTDQMKEAKEWAFKACLEADVREPWVWLAEIFYHEKDFLSVIWAASKAQSIEIAEGSYLNESKSKNHFLDDLMAYSYNMLGNITMAIQHTFKALSLVDNDTDKERLSTNLAAFQKVAK